MKTYLIGLIPIAVWAWSPVMMWVWILKEMGG